MSATFLSSGEGWILLSDHCAKTTCVQIERTSNAGGDWTLVQVPSALQREMNASAAGYYSVPQLSIHFSDADDGWIYGTQGTTA